MALLWQAALLLRAAPNFVSEAFIAGRIDERTGRTLGTLPAGVALRRIVDRAAPA
jgi:putative acyl-CoA dehydrogenase